MLPRLDIKEKNFHGLLAMGALAGIGEGSLRYGLTLHTGFPGMALTLAAALLGGVIGFFFKDFFRSLRGLPPYRGINNDGWIMGAFMGAFVGTLFQVVNMAGGANLVIGSVTGACLGAALGAFPDEFITPILELMDKRESDARPAPGQ